MKDINKGGEYRQYVKNIYSNQSEKSAMEGLMSFATENGFDYRDVEKALQVYKYDTEENAFGENYYTKIAIANMIDMISGNYAKGTTIEGESFSITFVNSEGKTKNIFVGGKNEEEAIKNAQIKLKLQPLTWSVSSVSFMGKYANGGGIKAIFSKEGIEASNPFAFRKKLEFAKKHPELLMLEMGGKSRAVDMYYKFDINKSGNLSATIKGKNYEVIYRDDISGMYDLFENDKKIKSSKVIRDLMQFPKEYKDGGAVESEINELYKKSKFINDDFNWKLKLMEMIQDRSIEAYNIYQSLTKEQKEEVLQEQFEVDNDMGSDGDGTIKTTKENIRILLNDAKNGTKYEEFSLGGKIDNGYFNNCFLKSIFGV